MPYELDYKKVHNTFKPEGLDNVFGYTKGQVANLVDTNGFNVTVLYLTEKQQQFVIQNLSLDSIQIQIRIYDTNNIEINFDGYNPHNTGTETLVFGESIILETPTNQAVYQNGVKHIPKYIDISGLPNTSYAVGPTYNNICGIIDENNIIISNNTVTPLYQKVETIDGEQVYDFINGCELTITENDNYCTITVTQGQTTLPSALYNNGFDVVLIPMRNRKGGYLPLRSITNTRNSRQFSLYGLKDTADYKYKKVSLYLEPISLLNNNGTGNGIRIFDKNRSAPLPTSNFTPTLSRQGFMTYGLKSEFAAYAMYVCRGCGYEEGSNGGTTKISFAIGVQEKKATAPHSGCSLKTIKTFSNSIELPRLALARTDNTNCVIILPN